MTRRESLERGTAFLDEATENLTFDEYHWALEEAWRGVAWVLNALAANPQPDVGLCAKGAVPARDTLAPLLRRVEDVPREARVVARLEALHDKVFGASDLEIGLAVNAEAIEDALFRAWELRDVCSERMQVVDERLGNKLMLVDPAPGKVGSQFIHRRTALKLLLAGSVVPLQACSKVERDNRPRAEAPSAKTGGVAAADKAAAASVARVTPIRAMQWETSDPFLFCAYHRDDYPEGNEEMGPSATLAGRHLGRDFDESSDWRMYHGRTVPGFPRHPHRGFETVTVVRSGMLDHSDSLGATARYGGGDVQWLTSGAGIQHAEMFPLTKSDSPNPLELFQIWLNLPRADKMVDPHFTMLWNEDIPRMTERDSRGRMVELTLAAGTYGGLEPPKPPPNSWASKAESDLAIWTIKMEPGATYTLPAVNPGTNRSLYVFEGAGVTIAGQDVGDNHRAIVEENGTIELVNGSEQTEILLLQARPIDEPVAKRGPFVMNTQDEIRQAYADYQRTQFGGWPWRDGGPVHERTKGRFARHIDGTFEEPT